MIGALRNGRAWRRRRAGRGRDEGIDGLIGLFEQGLAGALGGGTGGSSGGGRGALAARTKGSAGAADDIACRRRPSRGRHARGATRCLQTAARRGVESVGPATVAVLVPKASSPPGGGGVVGGGGAGAGGPGGVRCDASSARISARKMAFVSTTAGGPKVGGPTVGEPMLCGPKVGAPIVGGPKAWGTTGRWPTAGRASSASRASGGGGSNGGGATLSVRVLAAGSSSPPLSGGTVLRYPSR